MAQIPSRLTLANPDTPKDVPDTSAATQNVDATPDAPNSGTPVAAPEITPAPKAPPPPKPDSTQPQMVIRPVAPFARARRRHWALGFSFVLLVLAPTILAAYYLWAIAHDQYASTTGFTVRQADTSSAIDLLGGLSNFSGSASGDADVLYEFIQSQELVARIDDRLDLRALYSKAWPDDPVFAFNPEGAIEDLLDYWSRMVRISYDAATGLIELRVLAFDPNDAQAIDQAIVDEGTRVINALSDVAREDATRYAREELDQAVERLKNAREAITAFRSRNQIVDPNADIQVQMGLLGTLNEQLAGSLITLDLLRETTRDTDPRIAQAERRIEVIEARIADERRKFGVGEANDGSSDYANIVAEFERLAVDREFAERAYTAALSAYDAARAEAQRQSRYLAAYVRPTLAETAEYPDRPLLIGLIALFLLLAWSILSLIYYSLRDRR